MYIKKGRESIELRIEYNNYYIPTREVGLVLLSVHTW